MLLPATVVEVQDVITASFRWSLTIPARMATTLIVIALIIPKLVLQISRAPEEGLIQ